MGKQLITIKSGKPTDEELRRDMQELMSKIHNEDDKVGNVKNAFGRQIERLRNKLDEIRAENERRAEEKMDA